MSVSRTRLPALARKYRLLFDLRRASLPATGAILRPLVREFPGALRELDCLPLTLLEQRLTAVVDAEEGATPEPWIGWMLAYHERMGLALRAKERLGVARLASTELMATIANELSCTADFVARVARPPQGRLNVLVFELLEQELGAPRAELERALFPRPARP